MHFNLHPKTLFPGQQPDEKIYLVTRPHWFVLFKRIMLWSVFVVFLFLFDDIILPVFPALGESPYNNVLDFIEKIYTMFLVASLFTIWIIYYLNLQIITNERIVDMDQHNLLHHQISELHIMDIEDVTAEIKGLPGMLFNYGYVYVQTAGQVTQFEFDNVPNPHKVAKLVIDLHAKQRNHRGIEKNYAK